MFYLEFLEVEDIGDGANGGDGGDGGRGARDQFCGGGHATLRLGFSWQATYIN